MLGLRCTCDCVCSHHFVRDCSTTGSDKTACFSHQKGEHMSGACETAITSEENCGENIPMACTSVVSECVCVCVCVHGCTYASVCTCVHACVIDQLHTREAFTSIH